MNASFVRKSVASGHGLVRLHRYAGDLTQHLAGEKKMFACDSSFIGITIATNPHCHHNFFERGIARALADSVDGALPLARSGGDCRHAVRNGHSQVVMAMRGDGYLLESLPPGADG